MRAHSAPGWFPKGVRMRKWILVWAALGIAPQAQAWGGRGHDAICQTAVFLVKEPGLKAYLQNKPQMMSHLCNMPDTYWRSLGPEATKLGNPTHFIDVEIIGLKETDVPTDFKAIANTYTGKPNPFKTRRLIASAPTDLGAAAAIPDQF